MVDIVDKRTRSRMMSGIRGSHTSPELAVRRALFAAGIRYRLHARNLPGRPDIVLPRAKLAIFVHGCFWHRHPGCRYAYMPRSNIGFWKEKFESNVARDRRNLRTIRKSGWKALVIWECQINERRLIGLTKTVRTTRSRLGK